MSDKTFIDTNVLIYAHDTDAGAKHEIAKTVLRDLWSERTALLAGTPGILCQRHTKDLLSLIRGFGTPCGEQLRNLVHDLDRCRFCSQVFPN